MAQADYHNTDVVGLGKEIYERDLRARLETDENIGKILVIDVETGEYDMDADQMTLILREMKRKPEALRYFLRIGYPAVFSWRGKLEPNKR